VKTFDRAELRAFLKAVDANLDRSAKMLIIGGAAASLRYGATRKTQDIDTWGGFVRAVENAVEKAREATGLDVPVAPAGVAEAPYHFEDRLVSLSGFRHLIVRVPDRYDLALMKATRGYQHDFDVIQEMHKRRPFQFAKLRNRFDTEMTHVTAKVGGQKELRDNFVALVERLFGRKKADEARVPKAKKLDLRV
jgi:hypothetical protein